MVGSVAAGPQLQERLGHVIADALDVVLAPHALEVRIIATHSCVAFCQPEAGETSTTTAVTRGSLYTTVCE